MGTGPVAVIQNMVKYQDLQMFGPKKPNIG